MPQNNSRIDDVLFIRERFAWLSETPEQLSRRLADLQNMSLSKVRYP